MTYTEQKFNIPELDGISTESVKQHLQLYGGYVKNFNAISAQVEELSADPEKNSHTIAELRRRRSFEFGGMRLHELYFSQFEKEAVELNPETKLAKAVTDGRFGSVDGRITRMKETAMMRGPGWAILYFDPKVKTFHVGFSGEQHNGHFVTLPILLALDVWEHAYILDYGASGKGKYVDAFFKNLNWEVVASRI